MPELATIAFLLVSGWAALWPVRGRLGPVTYHLAAIPVGVMAAPLAAAFSSLSGRPLDAVSAALGALALAAGMWGIAAVAGSRGKSGSGVRAASFAVTGMSFGVMTTVFGVARYTVANNDSIVAYWPLAVHLNRVGVFTDTVAAQRSALIPSLGAVHAAFGSDWAYVIYPLLAAVLVAWMAWSLASGPLAAAGRRTRLLVAGGAVAFLAVEPSFLFHAFFVHSHMVSALYLFLSLACIRMALAGGAGGDGAPDDRPGGAHLMLAGLFVSGLVLARPDGLAYQFVPVAVAIAALSVGKARGRDVAAFFGSLFLVVLGVYAAIYAELGIWSSSKLSGRTALMILGVLVFSSAGPWLAHRVERATRIRLTGERFLSVLTAVAALLMLVVFATRWESARGALGSMSINLFGGAGGYHYLWYAVVAVMVVSLFTKDALRPGSSTRSAFLALALFFVIAGLVHGTSHEGRIGVGDSLNRIVFHALPLAVWYAAAIVARIAGVDAGGTPQPAEQVRADQTPKSSRIQSHSA